MRGVRAGVGRCAGQLPDGGASRDSARRGGAWGGREGGREGGRRRESRSVARRGRNPQQCKEKWCVAASWWAGRRRGPSADGCRHRRMPRCHEADTKPMQPLSAPFLILKRLLSHEVSVPLLLSVSRSSGFP